MRGYKPNSMCVLCKGACCRNMGCHIAPTDFKSLEFEFLRDKITEGYISIDWWEGEINTYYLRIRNKDCSIVDPSWGGKQCILLTENGCSLEFKNRPLGARALKPKRSKIGLCQSFYTKEDCKNDWIPYQDVLLELLDYFRDN